MTKFEKIDLPWDINECLNAYEEFKAKIGPELNTILVKEIQIKGAEIVYLQTINTLDDDEKEMFRKSCQYIGYLIDNQIAYGTKEN